MQKIRALMLLRNKRVQRIQVDPTRDSFEFRGGVYMLSPDLINLDTKEIPESYYFEGNPTPINFKGDDRSPDYLNLWLRINFIEQVDNVKTYQSGFMKEIMSLLSNPQFLVGTMLGLAILYSLLESGGIRLF